MPRLGQILLAAKAVTESDLESALENHVLHGVKLGTCLVEMGYVTDDTLARCLGEQTGYDFLNADQLLAAGEQNLSLIAPAIIKKHRLVPVGPHGTAVRVGTDDYLSPTRQAELEQHVGRRIEPVAVSGYAVDSFLEHIFGIQRPGRFLSKLSRPTAATEPPPPDATPSKGEGSPLIIDGMEWKPLGATSLGEEPDLQYEDLFHRPDNDDAPLTVANAAELMNSATSRDDVAGTVLAFVAKTTETAALVIMRDGIVRGWSASTRNRQVPDFDNFSVPLATLPALQQCVTMKQPHFGTAMTPEAERLRLTLKSATGVDAYFPIFIQQRVVAVLCCSSSAKLNSSEVAELCRKASYALEILVLRSKLLG